MSTILERVFWRDTAIRTAKTTAQAAFGVATSGFVGVLDLDWVTLGSVSGLAGFGCVLMCIANSDGPGDVPEIHNIED